MNINYENYELEIYGSLEEKQIKCIVCEEEDSDRYYLYLPNKTMVILNVVCGMFLDEIQLQPPKSIELADNGKIIVDRDNTVQTYKFELEQTIDYKEVIKNVRSRI